MRSFGLSQRLKASTQGPRLLPVCLYGIVGAIILIFLANYRAFRPLWRFAGAEAALLSLILINIVWARASGHGEASSPRDWAFPIASSALVLAAAVISGQSDVMYFLSFVCVQAYFKWKIWPGGIAFGTANLIAWLAVLVASGGSPWTIVSKGLALAIGILFGALMVSLILELQAANRELESSRQKDKELAIAEERLRLARELHDSVTQSLYAMNLYAEAAADLVTAGEIGTAAGHLREIRDTAQEALREMRLFIFELHSPGLESAGLAGALRARLAAVEERGGMEAELTVEGREDLTQAVRSELYGIAREALNNALKHSKAPRVSVRLRFAAGGTELEVSDDGGGFDSAGDRPGGFGIPGMKERASRVGGALSIDSAPGKGTKVTVLVPGYGFAASSRKGRER